MLKMREVLYNSIFFSGTLSVDFEREKKLSTC